MTTEEEAWAEFARVAGRIAYRQWLDEDQSGDQEGAA
jgi:hypothetical protein